MYENLKNLCNVLFTLCLMLCAFVLLVIYFSENVMLVSIFHRVRRHYFYIRYHAFQYFFVMYFCVRLKSHIIFTFKFSSLHAYILHLAGNLENGNMSVGI